MVTDLLLAAAAAVPGARAGAAALWLRDAAGAWSLAGLLGLSAEARGRLERETAARLAPAPSDGVAARASQPAAVGSDDGATSALARSLAGALARAMDTRPEAIRDSRPDAGVVAAGADRAPGGGAAPAAGWLALGQPLDGPVPGVLAVAHLARGGEAAGAADASRDAEHAARAREAVAAVARLGTRALSDGVAGPPPSASAGDAPSLGDAVAPSRGAPRWSGPLAAPFLTLARTRLGASGAALYRLTRSDAMLEQVAATLPDWLAAALPARLAPTAPSVIADAARAGAPVVRPARGELAREPAGEEGDARDAALVVAAVPLTVHARLWGVLVCVFRPAGGGAADGAGTRARLAELRDEAERALERVETQVVARAAADAKRDFLAVVGHELRTPLNSILGHVGLLADGVVGPLAPAQQEHAERARRSGRELLALVEEILSLTAMDAGGAGSPDELVDLRALVRDVLAQLEPSARQKGLRLAAALGSDPLELRTDAARVRHVLLHLVANAVKFTDAGEVAVSVYADPTGVECEVRDTGIGIAETHLERIFEPFWQAERPLTRRAGGMGLGLHVTRRFARLLGGEVTVRSEVGTGSIFTLRLPRRAPRTAPEDLRR